MLSDQQCFLSNVTLQLHRDLPGMKKATGKNAGRSNLIAAKECMTLSSSQKWSVQRVGGIKQKH